MHDRFSKEKWEEADREKKLKCSSFLNFTSIDIFLQKSEKNIKITHLSKGKDSTYLFSQSPIIKMK